MSTLYSMIDNYRARPGVLPVERVEDLFTFISEEWA